jgi:integrase
MAIAELSDQFCRGTEPPRKGQPYVIHWDSKVKGFGLRRTRESASFVFQYRHDDRRQRYTIGTFGDPWSTSEARARARELKKLVDRGEDPQRERVERRHTERVKDLVERWREQHSPKNKPRTQAENESLLEQWILPELGKLPVAEVDYETIAKLHLKIGITHNTPYRANRVLALCSKLFTLAVIWRLRPDNPVKGIERFTESARERPLVEDEFERLLAALDADADTQAVDMIRLLLLTGARVDELASATWGQFRGLDTTPNGAWDKPATNTKQRKVHHIPLNLQAAPLLADLKHRGGIGRLPGAYLFPRNNPHGYRHNLWPAWKRIRRRAGLGDVRLHDLRHHFATILAGEGVSLQKIGELLGHASVVTTQRYAHLLSEPLQEATNKVGSVFAATALRAKQQ